MKYLRDLPQGVETQKFLDDDLPLINRVWSHGMIRSLHPYSPPEEKARELPLINRVWSLGIIRSLHPYSPPEEKARELPLINRVWSLGIKYKEKVTIFKKHQWWNH